MLKPSKILTGEITGRSVFEPRRKFIKTGVAGFDRYTTASGLGKDQRYSNIPQGAYSAQLQVTGFEDVSSYTNDYEFSSNKSDSTVLAQSLKINLWSIKVEGAVAKPGTYQLEDILKRHPLEERIYRFRCVETHIVGAVTLQRGNDRIVFCPTLSG